MEEEFHRATANEFLTTAIDNRHLDGVSSTIQIVENDPAGFGRPTLGLTIEVVPETVTGSAVQFRLSDNSDGYGTRIVAQRLFLGW